MFFKKLLKPFALFLEGTATLLKPLVSAYSLFIEGLIVVAQLLVDLLSDIIHLIRITIVTIYRIIKGVILYSAIGIKKIVLIFSRIIKTFINIVYLVMMVIIKWISTIFIFVFKGVKEVFVTAYKIIKYIVLALWEILRLNMVSINYLLSPFKPKKKNNEIENSKIEKTKKADKLLPMELPEMLPMVMPETETTLVVAGPTELNDLLDELNIRTDQPKLAAENKRRHAIALNSIRQNKNMPKFNKNKKTKIDTSALNKELTSSLLGISKVFSLITLGAFRLVKYLFIGFFWSIKYSILFILMVLKFYYKGLAISIVKPIKMLSELPANISAYTRKRKIESEISKEKRSARIIQNREEKAAQLERKKEVKRKIKEASKGPFQNFLDTIKYAPKRLQVAINKWYNNLTFVKNQRNQLELKRQQLAINFEDSNEIRSAKKITFRYIAKNAAGRIEKGNLSVYSKLDVHSYLLSEGYEVYEIEPFKGLTLKANRSKIKTSDLVFFLTQLSTYIRAGIPLVESVKILGKQAKNPKLIDLYKDLVYDLTMGDNFSQALENKGEVFPRLLVNMIKASELAGNLTETLDDMADYYTTISKTRKQMISAMTYPIAITSFAMLVVVFILVWVIPNFVGMYREMEAELPGITKLTITISDFLVAYWPFLLIGLVLLIIGLRALYSNVKVFKTFMQWILMRIPIFGNIIIYNEVTMFAKTFSSLWKHNVFITDSMEVLGRITNNEIYKVLIFDAIANIAKGEPISLSFKDQWAFPLVAYEMLMTGERTGQPGEMMSKVADYYQEEHKNAVNSIKTFIEPVMIIFLAVVVGGILLSVILPMFSLYGNIAGA